MAAYQLAQELNDLRWGTIMPVMLMIGSKLVEVRTRGTCSIVVTDPMKLEEQVPDPEALTAYVKSVLMQTITEMLGERSSGVSDVAQLTAVDAQTVQAFQAKLESKFNPIGLRLKNVSIDAIESL